MMPVGDRGCIFFIFGVFCNGCVVLVWVFAGTHLLYPSCVDAFLTSHVVVADFERWLRRWEARANQFHPC